MSGEFQRVGLVINSSAGANAERAFRSACRGLEALQTTEVVTGPGALGADAVCGLGLDLKICDIGTPADRDSTLALAQEFVDRKLDTVIVAGGDGTMADVAGVFVGAPHKPSVLGIGAGSTNAGALVTCLADDVAKLDPRKLRARTLDALVVSVLNGPTAAAFNDCVFGTTVVGTIDDSLIDLDVSALMDGRRESAQPGSIGTIETTVRIVGQDRDEPLCMGDSVGSVTIGFAESAFRAKAITGGICLASHVGLPFGCLVADRPLAYVGTNAEALLAGGQIRTSFVALDSRSKVIVSGVREDTAVCADGNPIAMLGVASEVQIQLKSQAITALSMHGRTR